MKKTQSGFTVVEGLLILVIVVLVGGTGWYVMHASNQADKTYSNTTNNTPVPSTKKTTTAPAPAAKTHSAQEAVTFTQKTYDDYLAAINNAGTDNTQPLGLVGLAAVKDDMTADMYSKAAASHNGSDFSCAASFLPDKYTASLASSTSASAAVSVSIGVDSQGGSSARGPMTVSVDLTSLKITSVKCPS